MSSSLCQTMVASVRNWDWFFNNYRARLFVKWFGREGARRVYFVLGTVILGLSFFACVPRVGVTG